MLGFTPFKKHANRFNYIPRYYDPEREAREQRRAELRGERADDGEQPYRPGQYIRTQREARSARRSERDARSRQRVWKMAVGAVLVLLFIYMLYPRLADVFIRAQQQVAAERAATAEPVERRDAFDQRGISDTEWQEQPIVIVPNDYTE